MNTRIPFGYDIIDGRAVVNEEKIEQLMLYFTRFLDGLSMADAARVARLPVSSSTYPKLLQRKEYCGTEYYPAVITEDYQQKLVAEWQRRKKEHPRRRRKPADKGVRVYTKFRLAQSATATATDTTKNTDDPTDLSITDQISVFYQRIRPEYTPHSR